MNRTNHNFLHKHLSKSIELLQLYNGNEPLHFYLKKYFSLNKQHGSKDRKTIAHFCYTFFRIGKNLQDKSVEEKLKVALFVCEKNIENFQPFFSTEWIEKNSPNLKERIEFIQTIYPEFSLHYIFPYEKELSESIDIAAFQQSFLMQPKVFLRIRNGMKKIVSDKLNKANIVFETIDEDCISVPQNVDVASVLQLNKEAVVQDLSSQKIKSFLQTIQSENQNKPFRKVWDACAASGGKSVLAKDVFGEIDLAVSDIRPQILYNLRQRFREAGIDTYKSFAADLSNPVSLKPKFDLIICDAPCSGSGTWSRTPEMLAAFDIAEIEKYQTSQKKIVANCIPHLKNDGYFLYITCSVFEKENEETVKFIEQDFPLMCIKQELIKGFAQYADSMFAALFRFGK